MGRWIRVMAGIVGFLAFAGAAVWLFNDWEQAVRPVNRLGAAAFCAVISGAMAWTTWEGWRKSGTNKRSRLRP